ncbi:hypothetical protein [Streptomyces sp. NPDC012888]|uniref:hypothetical protein n=1 Tax=Streptomyces sp. NPDC012888 TaxID=3364855 RepID=UPI003681E980
MTPSTHTHRPTSRLRSAAVALAAASVCLVGGAAAAHAAPVGHESTVAEVRTFSGSGIGTSPSQAVDGAVRMAYLAAQSAGWMASQCYVQGTDVRWVGGGVYTAVAGLFCQR